LETSINPYEPPHAIDQPVLVEVVALRPWGFWATLGWGLLIAVGWLAAQVVVVAFLVVAIALGMFGPGYTIQSATLDFNGLILSLATLVSGPVGIGLCILAAWLRKCAPLEYLGLRKVSKAHLVLGIACQLIFIVAADGLTWLLGRPIVPEFVREAYETAGWLPLLIVAIVVMAPASEEVFFRGFLFRGLAESWLRPWGAIVFTSLLWALIHLQYDWYGMAQIFVAGLFLGWIRWRTGSITLTILLHALQNLVATIEAVIQMELLQ
jgi:membrane protease YdiL (CAAX protease family)